MRVARRLTNVTVTKPPTPARVYSDSDLGLRHASVLPGQRGVPGGTKWCQVPACAPPESRHYCTARTHARAREGQLNKTCTRTEDV